MSEYVSPIIVPIEGQLSEQSISTVAQRFEELQKDMPQLNLLSESLPEIVQPIFQALISEIESQKGNITKAMSSIVDGKAIGAEVNKALLESVGFFGANMKTAMSAGGALGRVMEAVPETMRQSFNAELSDMMRTASSVLHGFAYSSGTGAKSDASLQNYLQKHTTFSQAYNAFAKQYGLSEAMQRELSSAIIKLAVPAFNRADYIAQARQNAFGQLQKVTQVPQFTSWKDRLPERFQNIPDVPQLQSRKQIKANPNLKGSLSASDYEVVRRVAAENPTFERALTMAGVATRRVHDGKASQLIMPTKPISKEEYAIALGYMDKDLFRPGLEGAPMYRRSLIDADRYNQQALANKTSRVPTEGFSAFDALKGIGVDPVYTRAPQRIRYNYSPEQSSSLRSAVSVRPDMYQVQSLTWDDFRKGVMLGNDAPKQSIYDERPAGTSVNKMISRSVFTDLLGMHGHNTYGNGSTTDRGVPLMLQLDLSKMQFATKPDGSLEYGKDGLPVQNAETKKLVEDLFSPRASITSAKGGEYRYPVVPYGEHGNYVPTNIKNGVIWMAEENAYRAASQRFIDKYGVNAFDNLIAQDQEFDAAKTLNKSIEARNRDLTPSVPFAEIGGRMPAASKIGFTDLKGVMGLDGGGWIMPGYIPGEAGTIRSVGIKGSMMSVDYKKAYRDLYGEDAEWFLPFANAPEPIKKMFKEQGIDAVRAAYNNPETRVAMGLGNNPSAFYQHFFDAMKMDAVIDKSEIKTDFYDKMNLPEMQEAVTDIANMTGGWRMVATAKDFLTKSGALSKQVSQNLDLTPEELNANREKWDQYIFDLRNSPQKAVQRLFADQTVPLNKMLNENPGLLWEIPEAKSKVLEAIQSAELSRQHNKIFAEGDLLNALALPNIGEIMMKTSTGKTVQNKELARILGLGMNSKQDHDIVALAAWAGMPTNVFSGLRFPNNVTEQYALSNSQKYIDLLDEYGMSKDALYLNMKTIQKMGGGDVDGDTVTLARNQLHNIMVRTQKNRTAMIGEGYTPNISLTGVEDFDKRQANAGDFADLLYRQAAATFRMAAISNAADALAQGDWTDPGWVKLAGKGGIDLKAMYDIDSTFMKTGVASNWTAFAQNAKDLGKPFASVFKDLMGAVNENDYSMMADFSKVNFPSIYNGLTVSALEAIRNNPLSVQAVEKMIAAQETLQGIGDLEKSGRQADAAKAAYLRKNNELFTGLLTRGAIPSTKDLESLDEYLGLWRTELQTGKDFATTKEEKEYYDKQLREHSFQVNRMKHEGLFGIDERKRAEGLGYAGTGMLKNNPLSDQTTFFAQAYSDAEDQARMRRAIVEGANDHILSGVYKAAENQEERARIASAQAKADNLKYSWSMLHMLESGDPDKLQQWYKARINGERYNINTPEIAMGNAMSTLLQEYAAYATEHNQERGTSEMWEKRLDEILQTQHGNFFSELPTKDNNSKHTGKVLSTYERMHGFARALPGMFPEEDIVGAEIRVEPRMGNKVLVPGSPVKSEGFIDLQTRRRDTGELINTEMKPILGYPNIDDQVNLYNPERNAAYRRHLAYAETNDYTNPENYMRTMPYREEDMQAVERRMQNLTGLVQAWAGTGFQPDLMYRLFTPFAVNGKGQFVNGQPNVEDIAQGITAAQAVSDMYADARKTGFTIKNGSEKKFVEDENGDLVPVFDRNKSFQEERGVIDQQTGKGIAKAMSLESDVRDYENSMEEMANKLFSKAYKAEKTNKGQTGKGNFWDAYERQLSENYLEKRQEFESRGASKQDLARLDAANMRAMDMYEKALRESASADFTAFSQNIDEKIQAHGTTGAARGYAKEFDSLTESIDAASQAYQKFVKDMSSNLQEGDVLAVENLQKLIDEGKITEEDAAAFRKAEKARTEADQKSAQYRQILRDDANLDMQQRLDAFTQQATGRPLSAEQRVDRQTFKFTNDLAKYSRDIDLLEKKGVLSATDAAKYRQGIAAFNAADYRQVLMDNENNMAALREQANDHQIDQLLRQGDMLRRNRYGSRRGIIARGLNQRDQAITQQQNYKDKIDQRLLSERQKLSGMKEGTDEYVKTAAHIKELEQASQGAGQAIEQLSNPMSTVSAITAQFGDVVGRLATRLGRQLFRKALNEAKKFVQEFDKSMTTIQMITLKSDSQMSTLGDGLIAKAKELKISISEITQSAETLYRQGLSDEEVDERLDIISKFSKVSGTKVDAATKLITVAMNTGLVTDPQIAADIVTALGDNAATNASEIEKGIEKAGAAAAADGTTFAQLASMLTAITSTTQIGGNVAGRTLNTIFGRMNKIGTNELIYDENGNAVSGSAVAKLLSAQGIRTYDEQGNKRSSYDVLYDLSQKWDSLEDAAQQQLATQIAGTRQYSNFAAIMQGMSEGKVSEYMNLAASAEGITDQKYDIYTKSLQASLTDLKNTFDALVQDLVDKGYVQDFIEGITTMINGVDNLVNSLGGLQMALPVVMTMLGAISGLKFGGIGAVIGALAGLGTYAGLTTLGSANTELTQEQIQEKNITYQREQTATAKSNLAKAQNMYETYKNGGLSEADQETFNKLLSEIDSSLAGSFSEAERAALGLSGTFENVGKQLDAYAAALEAKSKQEDYQQFRNKNSSDMSSVVASRYANEDGRTYTKEQQFFRDYITENYSDDGFFGWSHNGLDDYMRDIVTRGVNSEGETTPGYFLNAYKDRIDQWVKEGQFVQYWKRENGETVPVAYTNTQDLFRDFATGNFTDRNGVGNDNDRNLQTLFNLMMGINGVEENLKSQAEFAQGVVSSTYGDRLQQSLNSFDYIDENLAKLVKEAFIGNVMQGVQGEIYEANAIGGEADIPGRISSESERLLSDMYSFFNAEDPVEAFKDYVVSYKKNDTAFLEEHAEELKGLNDEGMNTVIRKILFPTTPTLAEEEAEEIAKDVLHAGSATGYATWSQDKSNAYGLAADAMIRNLQTAGVTDMASLQAYLQTTNGQEWKYLTQNNGDLARLVSSVQYDAEGNIINPDVYDQIINTLYANSKYNGARFVSTQEKAKQAQEMMSSITSGETGYLSWEDALAAGEIEEQAAKDAYEAEVAAQVQRIREEYQQTLSSEELEKGLAAWETNYRATNPYVSQTSEQRAARYRVYSETEKAYLKEALGEELYQKVVDKKATQEEQDYANLLLSNRGYGLTALTSRQQYNWLTSNKSRFSTLGQEGGLSRTVADAYMSQWSGWPEYAALLEKKNTTGLSPEEQQQFDDLTQSLENFEQQSKIKIDIEGVQALEEAGKVADGTAAKLEKLQKGGHIAIEVEMSLQTEAFEQAQQNAKLNNGTISEQDEVAMSILGMSREQYYANRDSNYALAQSVQSSKNTINGNTWAELYNAEGLTDEQRVAIDAAAHAAGYRVTENDIYYDGTGRHSTRGYSYADNPELTNINPLVGEARSYSDNEKNRMLEQILADEVTRTVGEGGNSELYDAAISSAGTYTRELLRRKANGESIDNWLQIASDNERSAYQLQMLTGTSTRMTQAQQAQWAINNFSNPDSAGYLASFLNMNETDIKRLMGSDSGKAELQAKFEETQKAMYSEMAESLGIELDTSDMSSVKDQIQTAADNAEGLLREFLLWIAGTIDEAGNVVGSAGNKSFADIIAEQQKATREADLAMAEASKIIESKDYSQLKENTSVNWNSLNQQLLYMMNDRANNANSIFTDEMINDTYLNALYGRSSSPVNQQKILASLFGGNMSAENMISTYQGWMKDKEGHAAEIEAFNSLDNVEEITEAMTSQENAIEKTAQAVKEYNQQVEVSQTNYMKKYGERTAEVASKVENLRKSEKSATAELKNMTSTMSSLANNQYYRQQWMNGDRSSKTKENVATQLGLSDKKDLEAFSDEEITTRLKRLEISDIEDIQVDANAISESMSLSINEALGGQKLTLNGMEVNVDSGSVSLSWDDALSQLSGLLSQEEADFIAMLKAYHIEGTVVVNDTGNGLETHIEITGLGSGRKGGSSGGGGGKSASEKLVDKWKHRVTAQEHEVTMAGIRAQDAALANDGGSYIAAIDKQIEENEKLRKVYEKELEALKAQLSTVTEGSDDWWTLKEAIQSAEEAQAQLNKTIADLETSKINEIVEAYEYLASLSSHQTNLADSANRTARQDLDYEGWTQSIQDKVSARRSQTTAAQQSLADLQALYAAYLAGGGSEDDDTARSYIQQMNELEEVIASESADIRDLLSEQLEVARTQRDTELIIPDYYSTMLGYIVQKLDTENNATGQLAAIEAKKKTLQDRRDVYTGSNELLQQQLAEEYEAHGYSQHYYEILQEIYNNLENIAGIEQEISELTSQRLAVITEYFDNILNQNTHDKNMLQTQQTLLDYYNDYSGRKTNAQAQRDNIAERRTTLQHELNALTAEQANYAEGDENWIATRDKINAIKEELYGLLNDENSLNTEIFNAAKENFDNMMKPFTHADNMYAIDSERFGRLNDYENQNAVIDYQLINNGNKADVYKKTIEEMKALRAGVEEGSDAWWNYTNAINEAEESLAKLDNEAAKLRAQKLTNLLEKQANEDKTGSHAYDMLGLTASRAMLQEDYDAYYQAQEDKLYNIKDTIDQNKSQVSELEGLLAQFEIGSDEWLKTRDEIWKIKKETAQKENEAIQIEQEIAKQRLAQITQELNRSTKYFSHSNTMMQSYGTVYQRYGNYTGYRNSLDKQAENWQAIQAENKKAREQTLAEMAELEIGTAEWYNARDAVYAYDEALLRTEVELENLEKTRNLSFLQEVQNQFDDATRNLNYQLTAVRSMKTKASNNNSYENYKEYANMEKTLLQQQIASRNDYIESQKELMSQFTKETEEWKQAKQNIINAMSQNIADQTSIDQIDIDLAKSWVDKLFDVMDWADSETEHNLNLVQYEQTRYQNGNELTNYGIMLQKENEIRQDAIKRREEEIKQLKQEQAQLEENSTEYNRITEKIKAKEEAVKADTVSIEQNNKKLKENEAAIRQTRKELEDIVEKELKAEKERQKKMLDSEVSLQKTILDTIKQTYKDKWDLEKTDIKKQKEALQEYKQTLNDRLAARKNALDMEEKYRQLEEYQQQLTLISADPTRTKDAKTLREQIRSLEKDIAWDKASKEVEAEADAIDQAIESLDDYVTVHEEDLEALLADSRNFAEDVNLILQGSFESIVEWLSQNNAEFKNALDENREQMVQGWEQTWKDMYGIVDTYWDQIDEILSSYENFIDFMMQTPDYLNASVTQQWLILQDLADKYDVFAKSAIESIEAVNYALHEHEQQQGSDEEINPLGDLDLDWLDDIGEEAPDWTQSNEPPEVQTYTGVGQTDVEHIVTPGNIETDDTYDDVGIAQTHEDYHPDYTSDSTPDEQVTPADVWQLPEADDSGFGDFVFPTAEDVQSALDDIENPHLTYDVVRKCSALFNSLGKTLYATTVDKGSTPVYVGDTPTKPEDSSYTYAFSGWSPAVGPIETDTTYTAQFTATAKPQEDSDTDTPTPGGNGGKKWHATVSAEDPTGGYTKSATGTGSSKDAAASAARKKLPLNNPRWIETGVTYDYYKHGGLVDYTGPAWVDGTPTEPEAFLSAYDTKNIRALADALNYVFVSPGVLPGSENFGNNNSYGDIYITINQAELKDDADFEEVARRIGNAFTKQMSKQGFNMNGYSF